MSNTVKYLREEIARLHAEIKRVQGQCTHRDVVRSSHSDTGNWCKSDDRYWYRFECKVCEKVWDEDQ